MDLNFQPTPLLWVEDGNGQVTTPRTRRRIKKKKEFVGWGSKQLIEFLKSIGKQTDQPMSQHDITDTIIQYINEMKLLHPEKKKKVMCDERLFALFGRKSVNRVKIHDLLEDHLAENQVESDDLFDISEEEDVPASSKRQKISSSERKSFVKKKAAEVSKNSLVAISPQNIKLVYLKRSLVQELLKHPEHFESKVVGSFVRIKSDPLDIFQKNSYVIHLVTGVKAVPAAGDNGSCTLLQISGMDDVSISALSEDDFTKEECDDLRKRVKDGLLKQPTVGELEQKVEVLHEDITKHWLARELVVLKNLIDRANEKGLRYRVAEYLDRRKLLQTPAEQSRLLSEIPKVMPEEVKPDTVDEDSPDVENQKAYDSPKAIQWDWEACYDPPAKGVMINFSSVPENQAENVEITKEVNGHAQFLRIGDKGSLNKAEVRRAESNGHCEALETTRERDFPGEEVMATEVNVHTHPSIPGHIDLPNFKKAPQASNGPSNQSPRYHGEFTKEINFAKPFISDLIDLPGNKTTPQASNGPSNQSPRYHEGFTKEINFAKPIISDLIDLPGNKTTAQASNGHSNQSPRYHEGFTKEINFTKTFILDQTEPGSKSTTLASSGLLKPSSVQEINVHAKPPNPDHTDIPSSKTAALASNGHSEPLSLQPRDAHGLNDSEKKPVEVIDLSDDDDERQQAPNPLDQLMWYYLDPRGHVQGPFSLRSLKRWKDAKYFNGTFRVWKTNQRPDDSVLLTDILRLFFPS